jgi:predicted GNAT family acetyltransferase
MEIELSQYEVNNNEEENRFELIVDDHTAVIEYFIVRDSIVFTHTGVPTPLEGQGVASKMAKTTLEYAKAEGLWVIPKCPFVRSYIKRHSEYMSLVAPDFF